MPTLLPASQCTHKVSPMFTIVIHAHVTCTCFHAHERPGIRRSREIGTEIERGGQYACTCTGVLVRLEVATRPLVCNDQAVAWSLRNSTPLVSKAHIICQSRPKAA